MPSAVVKLQFGGIDCLWNNAGYQGQIKPTLEYDPADFATVMNINVTGMFIVLQAVGKVMAKQETGGTIVNTASVAGIGCTPAMVAYASSKAAVLAMTVSSAKVREYDCVLCLLKFLCFASSFVHATHVVTTGSCPIQYTCQCSESSSDWSWFHVDATK